MENPQGTGGPWNHGTGGLEDRHIGVLAYICVYISVFQLVEMVIERLDFRQIGFLV